MQVWPPRPPTVRRPERATRKTNCRSRELLQVVGRRRWLLLGCVFLGGLVGMAALEA